MAEKGLANPLYQHFANLFLAHLAGLAADFGGQISQIKALPTLFSASPGRDDRIRVSKSAISALCQPFIRSKLTSGFFCFYTILWT